MPLYVEIRKPGAWIQVGAPLTEGDAPGSISHHAPDGRQIYVFACLGDRSVVRRSIAGLDMEIGMARVISAAGLEDVAVLTPEDPECEIWVSSKRSREPRRMRLRHG